ncbi:MAG: tetratricopeptide repeat protein [Vulcanimicrobiota bacterium]
MDIEDLDEFDCREALKADPHNPAAHLRLGQIALERGGLAEAESHFLCLSERLDQAGGPLLMLGEVLQLQGRLDEAELAFQRAVKLEPDRASHWTALGLFYLSAPPSLELAQASFTRATELDEHSAQNWQYLGQALIPIRPEEAVKALTRAVKLDGQSAEAHFFLGLARYQLKDIQAACDLYQRALQLDSQRAGWWDQLGGLYLDHLEDAALARNAFARALQCPDADETYARANLFWACLTLGDLPEAKALRPDLVELEPVGLALCDAGLTVMAEGVEAARVELERLSKDPQVEGDYEIDWTRLRRLVEKKTI